MSDAVSKELSEKTEEIYMAEAVSLGEKGDYASPNPRVGCVIVRDGKIIGRGWHKRCGGPHAEVEAVHDAGGDVEGADVYVTLEPCCHFGKTPPCADMLIKHKIKRVFAGIVDPNPLVAGHGFEKLRNAGIDVKVGVREEQCRWLNRGFIRRVKNHRPWIMIKSAVSLDGKIALSNGESKWITGELARAKVHELRAESDALLTGVGTVIADNPQLTVRNAPGRTPLRIILDRSMRTPLNAKIIDGGNIAIITLPQTIGKIQQYESAGVSVRIISSEEDFLVGAMREICSMGVNRLMVEAGSTLTSALIKAGLCDELALFMAPKIIGAGKSFAENLQFASITDAVKLKDISVEKIGEDLLLRGVFQCSPDL